MGVSTKSILLLARESRLRPPPTTTPLKEIGQMGQVVYKTPRMVARGIKWREKELVGNDRGATVAAPKFSDGFYVSAFFALLKCDIGYRQFWSLAYGILERPMISISFQASFEQAAHNLLSARLKPRHCNPIGYPHRAGGYPASSRFCPSLRSIWLVWMSVN